MKDILLAACLLVSLVPVVAAGTGSTRTPTRTPTKAPTKPELCCAGGVANCLSSPLVLCMTCPTGKEDTWIVRTDSGPKDAPDSVKLQIKGTPPLDSVISHATSDNWKPIEEQKTVTDADMSCYGSLQTVKKTVIVPGGSRSMKRKARVNYAKATICKAGGGESQSDTCAQSKVLTLCRIYDEVSSQHCAEGNAVSDSTCDKWLKTSPTSSSFMIGKAADEACWISQKVYTTDNRAGKLWQLCRRQCWLASKSTSSTHLNPSACVSQACTKEEESFIGTAI